MVQQQNKWCAYHNMLGFHSAEEYMANCRPRRVQVICKERCLRAEIVKEEHYGQHAVVLAVEAEHQDEDEAATEERVVTKEKHMQLKQ